MKSGNSDLLNLLYISQNLVMFFDILIEINSFKTKLLIFFIMFNWCTKCITLYNTYHCKYLSIFESRWVNPTPWNLLNTVHGLKTKNNSIRIETKYKQDISWHVEKIELVFCAFSCRMLCYFHPHYNVRTFRMSDIYLLQL